MGYFVGIKFVISVKIFSDIGGEGIVVLCKVIGFKCLFLKNLWILLKWLLENEDGMLYDFYEYLVEIYDFLSVVKV